MKPSRTRCPELSFRASKDDRELGDRPRRCDGRERSSRLSASSRANARRSLAWNCVPASVYPSSRSASASIVNEYLVSDDDATMLQLALPTHVKILAIDFRRPGEASPGFGSFVLVAHPKRCRPMTEVVVCQNSIDANQSRAGNFGLKARVAPVLRTARMRPMQPHLW